MNETAVHARTAAATASCEQLRPFRSARVQRCAERCVLCVARSCSGGARVAACRITIRVGRRHTRRSCAAAAAAAVAAPFRRGVYVCVASSSPTNLLRSCVSAAADEPTNPYHHKARGRGQHTTPLRLLYRLCGACIRMCVCVCVRCLRRRVERFNYHSNGIQIAARGCFQSSSARSPLAIRAATAPTGKPERRPR